MRLLGAGNASVDRVWGELANGLRQIFIESQMLPRRYFELYTSVYDYCTASSNTNLVNHHHQKHLEFVGIELYARIRDYLAVHVRKVLTDANDNEIDILIYYTNQWERFQLASKVLNGVCSYLNRSFRKQAAEASTSFYELRTDNVYEVYNLALFTWKTIFFDEINQRLTRKTLEMIKRDRQGEEVDTSMLKKVIDSYVEMGHAVSVSEKKGQIRLDNYERHFLAAFLDDTGRFYAAESQAYFERNNQISDYLKKAEARLVEEDQRCERYLHASSLSRIREQCEAELIDKHKSRFNAEFSILLVQNKTDDLSRMFTMCQRIEKGLEPLRVGFGAYVKEQGMEAMAALATQATVDPKLYVQKAIEVYERAERLNQNSFGGEFKEALDKAASKFINQNKACEGNKASLPPELVARYCDTLLKKSNRTIDDSSLDEKFNQVLIVFKYIEDKDIFQKIYSKLFANRLIKDTYASEDAEESMIKKLKEMVGHEYTSKLSRMFTDITVSKNLNKEYKQKCESTSNQPPIDLNVKLLTTGSWPYTQMFTLQMPVVLESTLKHFSAFYNEKHNGRTLSWLYSVSKGEMMATYKKAKYQLVASTIQMTVLLQFNRVDKYTVKDLSKAVGCDCTLMQQVVATLIRNSLILRDAEPEAPPDDRIPEPECLVRYNKEYTNKRTRVNIHVTYKLEDKVVENTHKNVEEDRKLLIQAAIVRIMKMRKTSNHQNLVSETIQQLASRFTPSVPMIKKCVETLIEKEYLERSPKNRDVLNYLA